MRKFVTMVFFLSVVYLMFAGISQAAASNVVPKLYMNGKLLQSTADPRIESGHTLIPIRTVAKGIGFDVGWEQGSKTVSIHSEMTEIILKINDKTAMVNNNKVTLDMPAKIYDSVTMVPLRFVGETLGLQVYYDAPTKSVHLYQPVSPAPGDSGAGDVTGGDGSSSGTPGDTGNTGSGSGSGDSPDGGSASIPSDADGLVTSIQYDGLGTIDINYTGTVQAETPIVLTNPERLVVDMPKTAFDPAFSPGFESTTAKLGEILVDTHPSLTKIRYSYYSDSPSTVRVVMDLNAPTNYNITTSSGQIQIHMLNPTVPPTTPSGQKVYKVVIDAGHGAKDPGAESISGFWEKNFNLSLALKVNALLEKEPRIKPYMTRSDDTFVELNDRAGFANNLNADMFISIHANKSSSSAATGSETYYYHGNSKTLADIMQRHLVQGTGLKNRGVKTAGFVVIKKTTMPGILMETGFLSNKGDEAVLYNQAMQDRMAAQIVAGIKEYLKL